MIPKPKLKFHPKRLMPVPVWPDDWTYVEGDGKWHVRSPTCFGYEYAPVHESADTMEQAIRLYYTSPRWDVLGRAMDKENNRDQNEMERRYLASLTDYNVAKGYMRHGIATELKARYADSYEFDTGVRNDATTKHSRLGDYGIEQETPATTRGRRFLLWLHHWVRVVYRALRRAA